MRVSCSHEDPRRARNPECQKKKGEEEALCRPVAQIEKRNRFFRCQRLQRQSDFAKFRASGVRSVFGGVFVLKMLPRHPQIGIGFKGGDLPRIGVITSKRIGKAVERNRVRRIVREFFRTNQCLFSDTSDYLFIALNGIADLKNNEIVSRLTKTLTTPRAQSARCANLGCRTSSMTPRKE